MDRGRARIPDRRSDITVAARAITPTLSESGPLPRREHLGLLAERFELVRKLGEGGYGVVYEALDLEWRTRVALKTLQGMDPNALLRFKEEFRSLQDVEHENLVHLGELMCFEGMWFFTMELVEGTDFFDHVRPVVERIGGIHLRRLDDARLRRALMQLVLALITVHQSGRVHCDIKPSNIRVDDEGRLVLLDFGLVTSVALSHVQGEDDMVLGTPSYMAPEQCRGDVLGPAADWYAVGVLLYEALTGRLPFDGPDHDVAVEKQHVVPVHPLDLSPEGAIDLADLAMQLLRIQPAERPSGAELLGMLLADNDVATAVPSGVRQRPAPPSAVPFIGRRAELEALTQHFGRTREWLPAFAYVSGESGVGKTSLVRSFEERVVTSHGALVLHGRCYERETVPYKAFDGIVDDLARHLSRLDAKACRELLPYGAKLLVQIFPVLKRVKALEDLPPLPLPQDLNVLRSHAFAALREILGRLSLDRALLLVIDDLQWTDQDSLSLLEELLQSAEAPSCMVVATGRPLTQLPGDISSQLEPLLALDMSRELPLVGLADSEAAQLARSLAKREHHASLLARIASEAKGHPLFVAELVRHVEAGHALESACQLDDALRARIDQLEPETRCLLETLAIASAPTAHVVLGRALALDVTELGRRLAQLRSLHLARSEQRAMAVCYHDRVRRVVLDALSPALLQQRHRALATALSVGHGSDLEIDVEQVAYQWRCAGDALRAARYCAQAAEAADRALAFNRAARLYGEALAQPQAFDAERSLALRVAYARALSCAGFSARAAEEYLAASTSCPKEEGRVLRRRAGQLMLRSGQIAEGIALADTLLDEVGISRPKTPTHAVVKLAWERTRLLARGLSYDRAPVEELHQNAECLDVLGAIAPSLAFLDLLGGSALQSQYARLSLSSGDVYHVTRALAMEALLRSTAERPPQSQVEGILQQVREIVAETQAPYLRAVSWMVHGYAHWVSFRLPEALGALVQAERTLSESCIDVAWELTNVRAALLNGLWNAGRLAQHDELARDWLRDARERGDRYAAAQLTVLGLGYQSSLTQGRPEAAEAVLDSSLSGWPETFQLPHWGRYIGRQLAALYRGDGSAYTLLQQTWPQIQRSQLLRIPYLALLTHADAAWACLDRCTQVAPSERRELMQRASSHVREIEKTRWPLSQALSDQITAQLHVLSGRKEDALAVLSSSARELAAHNSMYRFPTEYLAGVLLGGTEGQALIRRAEQWALHEGVNEPVRWFAAFAPVVRLLQ